MGVLPTQITLKWMIEEAEQCGLKFNPDLLSQINQNYQDILHNSYTGIFSLFPTQPRSIPKIDAKDIHISVKQRHKAPPIRQSPYRQVRKLPIILDIFAIDPWNATGIWLEAGSTYIFKATGEWMDSSIKCGPTGTNDGNLQFGEIFQVAGSILGKAEELFKKITGNNSADFRFTKRHEDMDWFCLVGAIANGYGVDAKDHCATHEFFLIGDGCTYIPQHSGYLYAYANDAWNCYENNRGRIRLEIQIKSE